MASSPSPTYAGIESLSQALSRYLQTASCYPDLTTICCKEESQYLLLEVEHPSPEVSNGAQMLATLEGVLCDLMPSLAWGASPWVNRSLVPVRIYLKVKEATQPYKMHSFTWGIAEAARVIPGSLAGHSPIGPQPNPLLSFRDATVAVPDTAIQLAPEPFWGRQMGHWVLAFMGNYWSYGVAVLVLLVSSLLVYGVTRPCVVGSCDRLEKSRAFYQLTQAALLANPTNNDIVNAQSDLQAAVDLLTPIPIWSAHYGSAQASLQRYDGTLTSLNTILRAQRKAFEAAQLSQAPPHPVERWVNVHLLWQQAIDQLATVPATSPAYDYAQRKLMTYHANYSLIGGRIKAEEAAEANFNTAIQAAQLASQPMASSRSVAGWHLAIKEWQAAIKGLALIPQGTMIYAQAQAQLKDYQQQLAQSMNRVEIEEASSHNYGQAIQAARAGATAAAKGQWNLAAGYWQKALASIQQIPADTTLFKEVPTLVETYQTNLRNAQNRLSTNLVLAGVTSTLGKICGSMTCTVEARDDQIRMNLALPYARVVQQAITPPSQSGINPISANLKQLIDQIINVSHQLNRAVVIYDSDGHFIVRYQPDLGGFSRNLK
ncbi:MAG: hypothetical protein ACOYMP_03390 [Nodosilinea sp.]